MQNDEVVDILQTIGVIQYGQYTLRCGTKSNVYIDLRRIISFPEELKKITKILEKEVDKSFDLVAGVPFTALSFATTYSITTGIPQIMRRKEVKTYGTRKEVEGLFKIGQSCLVIEDVITSGSSLLDTVKVLRRHGLLVTDVAVVVDRCMGGKEKLEEEGLKVHALTTLEALSCPL